jgi:hypothetical protein
MPINYHVKNAQFKTKGEAKKHFAAKSLWSGHLDGCAREVMRALEMWAKNNPDRWVYCTVRGLTEECNGKFRKGKDKGRPYSKVTVEQALRFLREKNLISHELGIAPDGRKQNGFVVAPHESMTRRYPLACNFVGLEKAAGTFVIRNGNGTWLQNAETDTSTECGLIQENDDSTIPETTPHTMPDVKKVDVGAAAGQPDGVSQGIQRVEHGVSNKYGSGYGSGHAVENPQQIEKTEDEQDYQGEPDNPQYRQNDPQPPEPREPLKPGEPPQPQHNPSAWCGWLSDVWNYYDENRDYDERLGALRFRRARLADKQSPDVTAIENLAIVEKDAGLVKLAWIEFCRRFPHDKTTKYPVTVFATPENFAGLIVAARSAFKEFLAWRERGKTGPAPDLISHAFHFKMNSF